MIVKIQVLTFAEIAVVKYYPLALSKTADLTFHASLTGVRALAVYMVYLHHCNPFNSEGWQAGLYALVSEFHIGINIFFVLSGFLITYRYSDLKSFNFKPYIIKRIARVYPMYFLLTSFYFLYHALFRNKYEWQDLLFYISNITFAKGFSTELITTGILQAWTLSVEELFYLTAPLIFILTARSKYWLIGIPILLFTVGIGLVKVLKPIDFHGFLNSYEFMTNYTFFGRSIEFFAGVILAVLYSKRKFFPKGIHLTYLGAFNMIWMTALLTVFKGDLGYSIHHPIGKIVNTLLIPLFGVLPFFAGLLTERSVLSSLLSNRWAVLLGRSSYVFYLIHIGLFSKWLNDISSNWAFVFILLNALAILLFLFVERPLNQHARKLFGVS